jgi:hypothetical protein
MTSGGVDVNTNSVSVSGWEREDNSPRNDNSVKTPVQQFLDA